MYKKLFLIPALVVSVYSFAQSANGQLKFEQGQVLNVQTDLKTTISQQMMGSSVDFNTNASVFHNYTVTNATDDNTTLRHKTSQVKFDFEGMGQKRPFDSKNEKDLNGPLGTPVKDVLSKTYDAVISPTGTVLMVFPEKFETSETDERVRLVTNMLKEVFETVNPPKKGGTSFFAVFPAKEVSIGETWNESYETTSGKFNNTYSLKEITDTAYIVKVSGTSSTTSKADMMGMEIVTSLNNTSTGTIIVDKTTGIVKQKDIVTESTGTTTGMGGETPLTAKTTTKTVVTSVKE